MEIYREAYEVYERRDGKSLACFVRTSGALWKAVMVESKRGERAEDPIRLAHWPFGPEISEHRTFTAAVAHVEKHARSWKRPKNKPAKKSGRNRTVTRR